MAMMFSGIVREIIFLVWNNEFHLSLTDDDFQTMLHILMQILFFIYLNVNDTCHHVKKVRRLLDMSMVYGIIAAPNCIHNHLNDHLLQ